MKTVTTLALVCALAAPPAVSQEPAVHPLAIRIRQAITVSGAPIDDAVIVIENGRITAIGPRASVDVPDDADVIDAGAMWATPGFIHPASLALTTSSSYEVAGRNSTADRQAADEIAPTWPGVRALAKAGVTRANVLAGGGGFSGQSVLIRPVRKLDRPIRPSDVVVQRGAALCMGFEPRTTTKTLWKESLAKAKKYRDDKAGAAQRKPESAPASRPESSESKPAEGDKAASRPADAPADPKLTPIADVFESKLPGIVVVGSPAGLLHLAPILLEFPEFKPSLMLLDDAWRHIEQVKKLGVPVILQPNRVAKPDTNIEIVPVRDFVDAGIAVALIPETSFAAGYEGFPFHLGELVRKGVAKDAVLRAVTLTPAEILGIQKDAGSLEKGKAADILLWTSEPLTPGAGLARVIVGGVTVYDEKEGP